MIVWKDQSRRRVGEVAKLDERRLRLRLYSLDERINGLFVAKMERKESCV